MVVSRFDDCRRTPFGVALLVAIATLALSPRLAHAVPDLALKMTVNTPVPAAGQPVEFTVTVGNVGLDASTGVVVTDNLPPELAVPAGMAVFPSVGAYDPATGAWTVGSLAAGASATLVIPAIVAVTPQPPCSVNVASVTAGLDATPRTIGPWWRFDAMPPIGAWTCPSRSTSTCFPVASRRPR